MRVTISRIKKCAITLYAQGQLPKELTNYIRFCKDDDKQYIELLKDLSEHFLRLKGYYKKYPKQHADANAYIVCVVEDYKKRKEVD